MTHSPNFYFQTTPIKNQNDSDENNSSFSPPIKLKICLGSNKTPRSSQNTASKSNISNTSHNVKESHGTKRKLEGHSQDLLKSKAPVSSRNQRHKGKELSTSSQRNLDKIKNEEGAVPKGSRIKQSNKNSDSEFDEEEKWLNAVESGNYGSLDQIDSELKNFKDPKLMTARQRAMVSGPGGRYYNLFIPDYVLLNIFIY